MNQNIIDIIKKKCEEYKITVSELEKRSGLKDGTIRNILRGRSKNPTLQTLNSISKTIGITIDQLLNESCLVNQNPIAWEAFLFIETVQLVENILLEQNLKLDLNQVMIIIQNVYCDALINTTKEPDAVLTQKLIQTYLPH